LKGGVAIKTRVFYQCLGYVEETLKLIKEL